MMLLNIFDKFKKNNLSQGSFIHICPRDLKKLFKDFFIYGRGRLFYISVPKIFGKVESMVAILVNGM